MEKSNEQGGQKMNKENGQREKEVENKEARKLKQVLQKAVNAEKAPDALRDRIGKMIREK